MYLPPHFVIEDLESQHNLMAAHPLGLLISGGAGGLDANPIPFVLDRERGTHGRLRGHLARSNPQWQSFEPGAEVLVVLAGWIITSAHLIMRPSASTAKWFRHGTISPFMPMGR